ncbi:hypothetical protein B9D92_20560, partial [Mycobacterium tuberculosis]
ASAPVAAQQFQFALPAGVASEEGLQVKTIWVARRERRPTDRQQRGRRGRRKRGRHFSERSSVRIRG